MIRLIAFIVIFAIFLVFIVLNLDNKCDISIGVKTFNDIPVFLSSLVSFVVGMLFAVPLAFSLRRKRRKLSESESSNVPASEGNKKRFGKKDGKIDASGKSYDESSSDAYNKEKSPYGID